MSYTSQLRIEEAITEQLVIELTDDSGAGIVDASVIAQMLTTADGEINGYLQAYYSVPLAITPGLITSIADDLVIYYLMRRRHGAFGMPEDVIRRYEHRIKQLEKINTGKLDLGIEPLPSSSSLVVAQSEGPDQVMTGGSDGSLKDF